MSQGLDGNFEYMSFHQLNELLCRFYTAYTNSEECLKSRLKWFPLQLSRHLNASPFNKDLDITCSSKFISSNAVLHLLDNDEAQTSGIGAHIKPISFEHLRQLYSSCHLSTANPSSLQNKVWTDINLYCGWLPVTALKDFKKSSFVKEKDTATARKYYRIVDKDVSYEKQVARIYEQPGNPFCPVKSLELYFSKLNPKSEMFFQYPNKHYLIREWYLASALGRNVLNNKFHQICRQAGLNTNYRNTALKAISKFVQSKASNHTPNYSDCIIELISGDGSQVTVLKNEELPPILQNQVVDNYTVNNSSINPRVVVPYSERSQAEQQIGWLKLKVSRDIRDAVHGAVQQLKDVNKVEWDYSLTEGRNPEINMKILSLVHKAFPTAKMDVVNRACRSYFITRKTRAKRSESNKLEETRKKQRKRQRQTNLRLRRLSALKRLYDISDSDKRKIEDSLNSTILISSEESDEGGSDSDSDEKSKRLVVRRLSWRSNFLNHWYSVLDAMTQKGSGFLQRIESVTNSQRTVPDDLPDWAIADSYLE